MNLANIVTCVRILLIPVVWGLYYTDFPGHLWWAAAVFGVASFSDWLDGYLARRLNQMSAFGAFLDPVADKLLVSLVLVMLASNHPSVWFILPVSLIIGREILVSALREWMAGQGHRDVVAVAFVGKVKTTVQMIAILILMISRPDSPWFLLGMGYLGLYLAALLSLVSMVKYFRAAIPFLRPNPG